MWATEKAPSLREIDQLYAKSLTDPAPAVGDLKRIVAVHETPLAALYLGLIFETGRGGTTIDKKLAIDYYVHAADKNSVAAFNAGRMLLKLKKHSEAAGFLSLAARDSANPVVQAMVLLAGMYENGATPVGVDMRKAAQWYQKAAAHNDPFAMGRAGFFMVHGVGGVTDQRVGKIMLNRAADAGNEEAQYSLWEMHAKGIGVKKNRVEAAKWAIILSERNPAYGTLKPLSIGAMTKREAEAARKSAEIWKAAHPEVIHVDYFAPIETILHRGNLL